MTTLAKPLKAFMFNIERPLDVNGDDVFATFIVWAADVKEAVNNMIAAYEIDENFTGSHGPRWSCEELVTPLSSQIVYGPKPGLGILAAILKDVE